MSARPQRGLVSQIRARIAALESQYTMELARIGQKHQLLYRIGRRLAQLRPLVSEYEVLSLTPLPSGAYRERMREASRAAQEYRRLKARYDELERELTREEEQAMRIREEIYRLQSTLTQLTTVPMAATRREAVAALYGGRGAEEMEQARLIAERIRELERAAHEAMRRGDMQEAYRLLNEADRLRRMLGGGVIL